MSIRVYDYVCAPCGFRQELFCRTESMDLHVDCPACGLEGGMKRQIPAPRAQLDGISGDFPSASDKWVKNRESHMAKEAKHQSNHGTEWIGRSGPSE